MLSDEDMNKIVSAVMDYWQHAVSVSTGNVVVNSTHHDFGRKIAIAIRQSFLRIHGRMVQISSEQVPVTWWDHFKQTYFPHARRNMRAITDLSRQEFLFPHVTNIEEVRKIAEFFDVL